MDTKSKKSSFFSRTKKVLSLIGIFTCVIVCCFCGFSIFSNGISIGIFPVDGENYYSTNAFYNQYSQLVRDVVNINLAYKDESNIKAGNALPEKLLMQNFVEEYNIPYEMIEELLQQEKAKKVGAADLYKNGSTVADNPDVDWKNTNYIIGSVATERAETGEMPVLTQEEINGYRQVYEDNFDRYKQRAIQEQLADYKASQEELNNYVNFGYYLVNNNNNNIISNRPLEEIKKQDISTILDGPYVEGVSVDSTNYYYYYDEAMQRHVSYYYNNFLGGVGDILKENNATLYVAVMQPLVIGDNFYSQSIIYEAKKQEIPFYAGIMTFCGVVIALLSLYLIFSAGRTVRGGEVTLRAVDKIYNDIQTVFVFFVYIFAILLGTGFLDILTRTNNSNWTILIELLITLLCIVMTIVGLTYLTSMSRQIKVKQLFRNTLAAAFLRWIGSLFSGKTFKGWMVFCMFLYAGINMLLFGLLVSSYDSGVIILLGLIIGVFNLFSAVLFIRALRSLTKIMIAVKETSKGNLNYQLDLSTISPTFTNFAKDVSNIQNGLKNAVAEAVKGERMKADLITNVSHDLKTPLTSIVTYVDLLKKETLNNETAKKYVDVLDEKSYRLKQLIEDLIEASKASSGNVAVHEEKVDLRQLVMQASGEFEAKIKNAGLNFRVSSSGQTYIRADGKHMWRIVENLITNAIKYSMPGSRVYIDIFKTESMGVLVMKNMSAQPIEVKPDQLMERFVRGEESRTTEGSGLGLSIAKSLTDIQKGDMEISVDGDLFKATIKMPLWPKEEEKKESTDPPESSSPDSEEKIPSKINLKKAEQE